MLRNKPSLSAIWTYSLLALLPTCAGAEGQVVEHGANVLQGHVDSRLQNGSGSESGLLNDEVEQLGYSDWAEPSAHIGSYLRPRADAPWISGPYFRAGTTLSLSDGIFEGQQKAGYTISGGVRQTTPFELLGGNSFLDLGGSYLSAFGQTTRTVTGSVTRDDPVLGPTTANESFDATLTELRRAGVHMALGWTWGDWQDSPRDDPQLGVTTRLGGRWNHVHGQFLSGGFAAGDPIVSFSRPYASTDTNGGLFAGIEAILLRRTSPLGSLQLTVDGEFGHDWVQLGGFKSGGLSIAALQFGFMLSR